MFRAGPAFATGRVGKLLEYAAWLAAADALLVFVLVTTTENRGQFAFAALGGAVVPLAAARGDLRGECRALIAGAAHERMAYRI